MVSSRWEKQNTSRFNFAYLIVFVSVFGIGLPATLFGLEGRSAVIASIIGSIGGIVLAIVLVKRQANSMIRVLKVDYQEIERDFRILFKDNNLQFNRKTEEDAFSYDFPGHNKLSMTIQPYQLINLGVEDPNGLVLPATKITLGELNAENQALADKLAILIDEMEYQRAGNEKLA